MLLDERENRNIGEDTRKKTNTRNLKNYSVPKKTMIPVIHTVISVHCMVLTYGW